MPVAFLAFLAVLGTGAVLDQVYRQRTAAAARAALAQQQRDRVAAQAISLSLSQYQRFARSRSSPEGVAELTRRTNEVNRLNASANAAGARIAAMSGPWPYASLWLRSALVVLLVGIGWSVRGYQRERRVERRRAAGQCVACGYDLQSSPNRCPECGTFRDWVRVPVTPPAAAREESLNLKDEQTGADAETRRFATR
jgi:hypothetical protein